MSVFSLTKGSEAALGMLARQTGSETLLLTQPARELRASINIERLPAVDAAAGFKLEAELFLRDQRHSMTLQHDDGANAQHLADWVEAVANGTLDTAQAIPHRQSVLLPCCRCEGVAIAYSYLAPAPAQHDLHGVKCRHRDCQSLEGATTAAAASDAWNDIQREELAEAAEPAPAQDEREAFKRALHSQRVFKLSSATINAAEWAWFHRPAQTEQQPVAWRRVVERLIANVEILDQRPRSMCRDCADCNGVCESGLDCDIPRLIEEARAMLAAPIAQTEQQPVAAVPEEWKAGFKLHEIHKALDSGLPAPKYWAETCDGEPHVHTKLWSGLPGCGSFHSSRFWPLYGVSMLAAPIAKTAPQPEQSGLVEALAEAAQSLETISNGAGKDEFMQDMADVRGYARSRARIARAALASAPTA